MRGSPPRAMHSHKAQAFTRRGNWADTQEVPVKEGPRRAGDPPALVASSEKIQRELGWRPRYTELRAIVETAWNWHSKHPRGYNDR